MFESCSVRCCNFIWMFSITGKALFCLVFANRISKAWCKTVVTCYIKRCSYTSFAPALEMTTPDWHTPSGEMNNKRQWTTTKPGVYLHNLSAKITCVSIYIHRNNFKQECLAWVICIMHCKHIGLKHLFIYYQHKHNKGEYAPNNWPGMVTVTPLLGSTHGCSKTVH